MKKVVLTLLDIVVVCGVGLWMAYLCVYFAQTMPNGALGISSKYAIFERNYLIPALIFGMTIAMIVATSVLYYKLRKKKLIGKRYLLLVVFNIVPFCLISMEQFNTMVYYWEWIYRK